jgi:hypothetical protein
MWSVRVSCNADALRHRTRTTAAAVALAAAGYLAMSGTTALPAAGQGSEASKGGWSTRVWPATPPAATKDQETTPELLRKVDDREDLFKPGPQYDKSYNSKAQIDIYGTKTEVEAPRPLLELGREQYTSGAYDKSSTIFGDLNPLLPGLSIYGDWRTAMAYNSNKGKDIALIATRLNLDVDLKITGTERIHAFFTPLQKNAKFTRYEFGGGDGDGNFSFEFDPNPQTLFFEGDLGSIYSGLSGNYTRFDVPFVVGLYPLFLQNGTWANDAILGAAVTIPAKNSAKLGLPNFDITFFAAYDNVDNLGILGAEKHNAHLFGVTAFIEGYGGYVETGYGMLQGVEGPLDGRLTHFLTAAYTRRYFNTFSNSTRLFANFGDSKNDEGFVIISENSLITSLPSTLIPYANFFVGFGNPQPLVDGFGAGILKNVGINFETDALTGYPKLDDSGSNAWGGAIGVQYLFGKNLDQQIVFELAMVQPFEDDGIGAGRAQYAFGIRYQKALTRAWLLRADATYQLIEGDADNFGIRFELRRKF